MEAITTIKPTKGFVAFNIQELIQYRELLFVFVERELKLRYRQTVIGGMWAIIQPFSTMLVFTILFGNTAKIFDTQVPYAVFSYAGLLLWTYFAQAVTNSSTSMINNAHLISKVYFPRLIIPISATVTGLVDYGVAALLLFGLLFFYRIPLTPSILLVPVVVFLTWLLATGMGFWLSAINVKYRDIRYALPFFIQLLVFFTPVIYPLSSVGQFRWILKINPMSGFIELHRGLCVGNYTPDIPLIITSVLITIVIFITGFMYFRSVEKHFADTI